MSEKPFHNPFASLAHLRGDAPVEPQPPVRASPPEAPAATSVARAVVRIERTGRGGKEVTIVEHLDLSGAIIERWLKDLKSSLGCGGVVEHDSIVLQGDHRKRLPALLTAKGVKKITVS
jgi:translation initiation factor 1